LIDNVQARVPSTHSSTPVWSSRLTDFLSSNVLPPVGAVLTSVLVGWRLRRTIVDEELRDTTPFAARVCVWLLRYVCPIAIAAVLASALGVRLSNA
jgi:SNF family Na+-dependent transporter